MMKTNKKLAKHQRECTVRIEPPASRNFGVFAFYKGGD
jgi:hypothetical protein